MEDEKDGGHDEGEADDIVPLQLLLEVEDGEAGEDDQGDDLLDGLELGGREMAVPEAVGRDLEAVFQKGDRPGDQDDLPEGRVLELEMPVPGEGHEDVRDREQGDGGHGGWSSSSGALRGDIQAPAEAGARAKGSKGGHDTPPSPGRQTAPP